jgi:hypothetical protein
MSRRRSVPRTLERERSSVEKQQNKLFCNAPIIQDPTHSEVRDESSYNFKTAALRVRIRVSTPLARGKWGGSDSQSERRWTFVSKETHCESVWVKDGRRVLRRPQGIQRVTYPLPSARGAQKRVAIRPAASEQPHPDHHRGPFNGRVPVDPKGRDYAKVA